LPAEWLPAMAANHRWHTWGRAAPVCAMLVTLLGFGLSVHRLGHNSLWSDEIVTAQLTRGELATVWRSVHADPAHLPLYYVLQWCFSWAGRSEWAVRLPSALAATVSVALAYRLGTCLGSSAAGLLASLLLATHAQHIWAAQEARYYALVGCLSLGSAAGLLLLVEQHKPRHAATFALVTAALAYSHFMALLAVAGQALSSAIIALAQGASLRRRLLAAWALTALLMAPIPLYLARLLSAESGGGSAPLSLRAVPDILLPYAHGHRSLLLLGALIGILGMFAAGRNRRATWLLLPCWLAGLAPLFLLRAKHFFLPKYLYHLFPLAVAYVACGWAFLVNKAAQAMQLRAAAPLFALALVVTNLQPLAAYYRTEKYNWRAAASKLAELTGPEDTVVMVPPTWPEMSWYYQPLEPQAQILPFGYGPSSLQALRALPNAGRPIFWVLYLPSGGVVEAEALRARYHLWHFHGVLLLKGDESPLATAYQVLPLVARAAGKDAVIAGPAWDTFGRVAEELGRPQEAQHAYEEALRCYAEPRARHRLRADIARLQGDYPLALSEYIAALEPAPDTPETLRSLAQVQHQLSLEPEAVVSLARYSRLAGSFPPELCVVMSATHLLRDGEVEAPGKPIDTPYCSGQNPASCYVALTTFIHPETGEARQAIFMHPPASLLFALPEGSSPLYFVSLPTLQPESWGWGSDGVSFQVYASGGQGALQLLAERTVVPGDHSWQEWVVALPPGVPGQRALVKLEVGPGPAGDYTADWAGWAEPMVVRWCG